MAVPSAYQGKASNITLHFHGGDTTTHEAPPQAPQPAAPPAPSGPPPTPIPGSLGADPAFNAFLAGQGLTQADLRNAATLQAGNLQANADARMPALQRATDQQLQHSEAVYNGRGLVNSSDHLNADARIRAAGADRQAALQGQTSQRIAALMTALGLRQAQGDTRQATVGNNMAGKDYISDVVNGPNPFMQAV